MKKEEAYFKRATVRASSRRKHELFADNQYDGALIPNNQSIVNNMFTLSNIREA